MSKTIQIRDVPDDVHKILRVRAAEAGMSLSDYVLHELMKVSARPPIAEVLRRAAERPGGVPAKTIVATIRAMRDGRRA